jgi:hypothetical protein
MPPMIAVDEVNGVIFVPAFCFYRLDFQPVMFRKTNE